MIISGVSCFKEASNLWPPPPFLPELPPPPGQNEFPQHPLGEFIEPDFDAKTGRRRSIFTDTAKRVVTNVIIRQESITAEVQSNISYETSDGATGDAYSMRTYQSLNSLATSVAISTNSLCSDENINGSHLSDEDDLIEEITRL